MRKSLWIGLALLVVSGAPVVYADSFTPTFTCTINCTTPPTALDVTFPSPTMIVGFGSLTYPSFSLDSSNLPGDQYQWTSISVSLPLFEFANIFSVKDVTRNTSSVVEEIAPSFVIGANGSLTFTPVTAPEPSSVTLMLAGVGLVLVMRKRIGQRLPQAS